MVGGDLSHDRIDMDKTVYERYMEALGSEHDRYRYSLRLLLLADVYWPLHPDAKARGNTLAICNLIVVFDFDCLRRSP